MIKVRKLFSGKSRKQLLVSISSLTASGLFSVAIRFIGSIVQARFVDPELLGYYAKFAILPQYLCFLHLGVYTSFSRQYPYYIGKKDHVTALKYAANALGWTYLICAINAGIFISLSIFAAMKGDWRASLGWATQILFSMTYVYMQYLGFSYKNSSEFVVWSKTTVISSISSLLLLPFVVVYHYVGLCMRMSFPDAISAIYAHKKRPLKIKALLEYFVIKKMMAFGLPLMVFAYMATNLWTAVERTSILNLLDQRHLGIFTFSMAICAGLLAVANAISQVFRPRIAMVYGSSQKNMHKCFWYCMKASIGGMTALLPIILLTYWLIDPLVRNVLPKYMDCIPIVRCLCWVSLVPVIDLPKQLLIVAKKTRQFGFSILVSFSTFLLLLYWYKTSPEPLSLRTITITSVACKFFSVFIANFLSWLESSHMKTRY